MPHRRTRSPRGVSFSSKNLALVPSGVVFPRSSASAATNYGPSAAYSAAAPIYYVPGSVGGVVTPPTATPLGKPVTPVASKPVAKIDDASDKMLERVNAEIKRRSKEAREALDAMRTKEMLEKMEEEELRAKAAKADQKEAEAAAKAKAQSDGSVNPVNPVAALGLAVGLATEAERRLAAEAERRLAAEAKRTSQETVAAEVKEVLGNIAGDAFAVSKSEQVPIGIRKEAQSLYDKATSFITNFDSQPVYDAINGATEKAKNLLTSLTSNPLNAVMTSLATPLASHITTMAALAMASALPAASMLSAGKRSSPRRKSPKRRSPKRRSPRRSPAAKRRSPRRSPRKSPVKRRSPRRSPRKSPRLRSAKRRSPRRN